MKYIHDIDLQTLITVKIKAFGGGFMTKETKILPSKFNPSKKD